MVDKRRARHDDKRPLYFLGAMVVFAIVCWFVLQKLQEMSRIQDCVMSGRRNCVTVDITPVR